MNIFFKHISSLLSLLCISHASAEHNCKDFDQTKNRLVSVMRAYQCEKSGSVSECKKFLGLGTFGMSALAGVAGANIGKKIGERIRNPDYTLCPLNFKSVTYNYDQGPKSTFLQIFIGNPLWAKCFEHEPILQRDLHVGVGADIQLINKMIEAK